MKMENLPDSCPTTCDMVRSSKEFASRLLSEELPGGFTFHNLDHTQRVVEAAGILSHEEHISHEEKEIVLIAAWFHDTGYIRSYIGHEAVSIEIATAFLRNRSFPEEKIRDVADCIMATKLGAHPAESVTARILQDADLFHLGHEDYFRYLSLLRMELETRLGKVMDDRQWFSKNQDFLLCHHYRTSYGQTVLEQKKQRHLIQNREILRRE